jgi:hypothetical protein
MIRPLVSQPLAGLSAAQGVSHPQGVFGVVSYNYLAMVFLNLVCLTVVFAGSESRLGSRVYSKDSLKYP